MTERRRDPRYARNDLGVTLIDGMRAESVNISSRGLYCVVDHEIPEFSKLKVCMELPFSDGDRYRIECEGVVVRSEPKKDKGRRIYSIAVYFLNLDNERAALIEDFLSPSTDI